MNANRKHEFIGEPHGFADNVEMAVGDRIKRPGEKRNPLHKRGLARAEVDRKTTAQAPPRAHPLERRHINAEATEHSRVGFVVSADHGVRVSGKTYGISLSSQMVIAIRIIVMGITVGPSRLGHCD